jgi:RNA 2',3'-cyclic 3'-phosphodiesterase
VSGSRIRLFVAVDIPDKVRETISSAVNAVKPETEGMRWVEPCNLHLTMKFIGEYEEGKLEELSAEVRETSRLCRGFEACLGGCGTFPSPRKARVIWLGMSRGGEEAGKVARKLDARLEKVGVKREDRPFRSHLTLARRRQPADCSTLLDNLSEGLKDLEDMGFEVGDVVLYRSILGPQGPRYIELERMELKGPSSG